MSHNCHVITYGFFVPNHIVYLIFLVLSLHKTRKGFFFSRRFINVMQMVYSLIKKRNWRVYETSWKTMAFRYVSSTFPNGLDSELNKNVGMDSRNSFRRFRHALKTLNWLVRGCINFLEVCYVTANTLNYISFEN